MFNKDMTIVFIGFDGYSDLWNDCFKLFNMFYKDNPYRTLFINNIKEVSYPGIETFHAGEDAEWSKKVQLAIKEAGTPYICLLLEDFFIGKTIDNIEIEKTVELIKKDNLKYYKLVNLSRAVKNRDAQYKDYKYLHIIPEDDEYGVSLQAAIWNKEYLKELLGEDNYNAWIFEFNRVKEAKGKPNTPKEGCVFDDRNIFNFKHGVVQSKYIPGTIKYFKKIGIELNVQRQVMSYAQYYKIRLISKGKYALPKSFRKKVKGFLERRGMKFVSTIREK